MTAIVTLWLANDGLKVLRPSIIEMFKFLAKAPGIFMIFK